MRTRKRLNEAGIIDVEGVLKRATDKLIKTSAIRAAAKLREMAKALLANTPPAPTPPTRPVRPTGGTVAGGGTLAPNKPGKPRGKKR